MHNYFFSIITHAINPESVGYKIKVSQIIKDYLNKNIPDNNPADESIGDLHSKSPI